jgi:EAL domain-containing protein (putative c-di-GMP-specific phosphodiesterase class I)
VPIGADSGGLDDVLRAADAACYVAKEAGGNRAHAYTLDDTAIGVRFGEMQWVQRLQRALDEKRLQLHYQLIKPLARAGVPRQLCEVFLRLVETDGQLIAPQAFIPAAERYNLIDVVDRWVIRHALRAVAEQPPPDAALFAVNISARSLGNRSFLPYVLQELESSGVAPWQIAFEVTETAAISSLDCAIRFISAVRKLGCQLVLDDFGCGLSSFAYLRDLPVDFLKIDGDFVRRVAKSSIDRALVESINQVGHVMGLETIAEGVEDDDTLQVLRQVGVDYVQGYLLDEPRPLLPG